MSQTSRQAYRWAVMILVVGVGFVGVGWIWLSLPVFLPHMARDFALDPAQSQFIFGSISISLTFAFLLGGFLGDLYSLRWLVTVGTLIMAASALLRLVLVSYPGMIVASLLTGLGLGILSPNLVKVLRVWFPPYERAIANAFRFSAQRVGAALAQGFLAVYLLGWLGGWEYVQAVFGTIAVVMAAVWFVFYRSPVSSGADASPREGGRGSRRRGESTIQTFLRLCKDLCSSPDIVLLTFIVFLHIYTFLSFLSLLPTWLHRVPYLPEEWVEFYSSFLFWSALAGTLVFPTISDRIGRRRGVLMLVVTCLSLGVVSIGLSGSSALLLGSIVLAGIGGGAVLPMLLTVVSEHPEVGPGKAGTAPGLLLSFGQIGGIIGPSLGGWVLEQGGVSPSAMVVGSPLILGVILLLFLPETGHAVS